MRDVKSIALDISSKTSVALTKIIFREFLNIEPVYRHAKPDLDAMLADSDCALLIGDPALMISDLSEDQRPKTEDRIRKFDLAETWKSFTGFGFVFAMWMANRDKAAAARQIDFAAARDEGLAHLDEIISNYETEITLTRPDFRKYLSENISYRIDDSMMKGLELYHKLAYQNGLCESRKELNFI